MNKNLITNVIGFVAGAVIASGVTYLITKKKYENIIDEEVASAREIYTSMAKDLAKKNEDQKHEMFSDIKNIMTDYDPDADIQPSEYCTQDVEDPEDERSDEDSDEDDGVELEVEEPVMVKVPAHAPYTISPERFGSEDNYGLYTLHFYWEDKVLTDENENIIDNPDSLVGLANLDTFGEYDEYTVYVRNDDRMADYEILLDERSYALSHS